MELRANPDGNQISRLLVLGAASLMKLTFSATQNQGSNQVYFTVLQSDGFFRPVTRLVKTVAR